jgi:hypothetical protein
MVGKLICKKAQHFSPEDVGIGAAFWLGTSFSRNRNFNRGLVDTPAKIVMAKRSGASGTLIATADHDRLRTRDSTELREL